MSIRDTFFQECEDLLAALVDGLAELESSGQDSEIVNAVFRAVHSIKGGAGAFGLDDVVSFAHAFETVLDRVREGDLAVDGKLLRVFHKSSDQLTDLVEAARDETAIETTARDSVLKDLETYLGDQVEEEEFSFDALTLDVPPALEIPAEDSASRGVYEILFRPHAALFSNGHEPSLVFECLSQMGDLTVELQDISIPDFELLDDSGLQLAWRLELTTFDSETVLHDAFEFVEGLCDLEIRPLTRPTDPLPTIASEVPTPQPTPSSDKPQTKSEKEPKAPKATLRVDLDRVDRLINTVGELIINQAMIAQRIEELDLPGTSQVLNELEDYKLLARDIQEGVMAIRAQPVKPLFQRMSRIVREAGEATGKPAKLLTTGEGTEVDKTVIERLADPLTHMIRNAVDHGLEKTDTRIAAGKPEEGTIRLTAAHRSGNVILEVSDDGGGLNREKILQTALDKGLVAPDVELTEPEIDNLLFLPGFSTAKEVSNLSGRGVGMDVVRNAVAALGGRISITSDPGQGTTFTIVLPLTLAVMDGFVISVADQTMVVPISSIIETIHPIRRNIHTIGQNGRLLALRNRYVPIVDVAENLGLKSLNRLDDQIFLLVSSVSHGTCALAVDAIHDQRQVVVKSLKTSCGSITGISAATILGNGKIALILDTEEIARTGASASELAHEKLTQMEPALVDAN
ncbi:chemotaxis protein CheA [Pseudoprimorskyibacter insulae]|uniref:Chemotaxis protein CheA n=1 Tax=Pseudoprimorskyibacter insulae TaxID=1695997 RepID=A0A2R8B0Z6_9RHOB|nr:chemotaxis protein CheA [Pseudoprimorskyibacter insulae]SPF81940.1 Chemotaxis protein CheA [Pseudoprimorskyibacter insulae]